MAFGLHQSLRTVPRDTDEASRSFRFSAWRSRAACARASVLRGRLSSNLSCCSWMSRFRPGRAHGRDPMHRLPRSLDGASTADQIGAARHAQHRGSRPYVRSDSGAFVESQTRRRGNSGVAVTSAQSTRHPVSQHRRRDLCDPDVAGDRVDHAAGPGSWRPRPSAAAGFSQPDQRTDPKPWPRRPMPVMPSWARFRARSHLKWTISSRLPKRLTCSNSPNSAVAA